MIVDHLDPWRWPRTSLLLATWANWEIEKALRAREKREIEVAKKERERQARWDAMAPGEPVVFVPKKGPSWGPYR